MKKLFLLLSLTLLVLFVNAQISGENINVTHYEIHVNELDFTNHTLQGETFVTFTATHEVQQVVLELMYLEVASVTATGATVANFEQNGNFLIVNLASPLTAQASATLDIVYGGTPFNETWGGVIWWGSDYVYNLGVGFESQPHNLGKAWFPCVDNFTDKATYDIFVTATNNKKAICGGSFVETIDNGDDTSTWHWNTPQEISTYHISFVVGDFVLWEDVYHGIKRDIPIEVYATPNLSDRVEATFANIHKIVAFFEEILGPYPFNRIGYITTSKGCMEHTDNIALATSIVSGNTSYEGYLAHELSHMWSGNLVTCAEAGDMWLNEGFAQFWGVFYMAGVYGESTYQQTMASDVNIITSWCNNSNNWIPLNNMPLDMTYDSDAVYDRGAVIVNTMMNYMGRENFLSALRAYFEHYAYQTATSEILRDALSQYSGIDMKDFFDTYVFSSGMPHYYANILSVTPVGSQYEVVLDLRYQHIGDSHIGENNVYELTFIGPDFQLATVKVNWNGQNAQETVILDFDPVGVVGDINNGWLDGKTQKNYMLKTSTPQVYAHFRAEATSLTDSVFVTIENHLVEPYDNPLIPNLSLSTKHFWTINRYDFGDAAVSAQFDYGKSTDGDIIRTENDSATLVYRKNANEPWHEIPHTFYQGSLWRQGRIIIDDLQSGEYAIAAWDKEGLGLEEAVATENKMQLYPNPAQGQVRVSWKGTFDGQIRIIGVDGKELKKISFLQAESVDFSTGDLPKGCHTVMCLDKEGRVVSVEKLIVK